jgi:hypothetical protein
MGQILLLWRKGVRVGGTIKQLLNANIGDFGTMLLVRLLHFFNRIVTFLWSLRWISRQIQRGKRRSVL